MSGKTKKRVLIPLANGAEEMETVILVDVLRRAGLDVVLAGLSGPEPVLCSRGLRIIPDASLAEAGAQAPFDLVVLPGGAAGAEALAATPAIHQLLRGQESEGRAIGAICAAPIALAAAGVGRGRRMTSHPSVKARVEGLGAYVEERVVCDGMLITSRGPGTAMEFALALVEALAGREMADRVAAPMILPPSSR